MGNNASVMLATTTAQCLRGRQRDVGKDASATPAKLPVLDWPDMKAKLPGNGAGCGNKNYRR